MFKLLTYKFPAISSKFQQAITLSPAQQVQPSVASHSAIFVLGDTASYVIYQSNHNSKDPVPTHTNRKKSGENLNRNQSVYTYSKRNVCSSRNGINFKGDGYLSCPDAS